MGRRGVGAGLPQTGTSSLRMALEHPLGGPCLPYRERAETAHARRDNVGVVVLSDDFGGFPARLA